MKDVNGKVAVITGAASGIGRGMAESFADAGIQLVLSDVRRDALEQTTQELRAAGAKVIGVPADVSKAEDVQALAQAALDHYGSVHILCNNAGVGAGAKSTWDATLNDWNWLLGVNLMGVVHGVHFFMPILLRQEAGGHIVNTASLAGLTSGGGAALYSTSKFGVVALSEHVYLELKQMSAKVSISVLCPGFVSTDIQAHSERLQAEFSTASERPQGPFAEAFRDWFAEQVKAGLAPRQVGDQVLAAIQADRFYVLTHPEFTSRIERRNQRIVSGKNPELEPPANFDSLLKLLQERGIPFPSAAKTAATEAHPTKTEATTAETKQTVTAKTETVQG